jgi:tetratricopeptide (TPR) repeat protein
MGRWREAVADLSKVIEAWPNDPRQYWFLAMALVKGSDPKAYRGLSAQVRKRFGGWESLEFAPFTAKVCLLVPSSDPENVVAGSRLADAGVRSYKGDLRLFSLQSCKALADYRQGHFSSAAEWASKALSQPDHAPLNELRANCRKVEANMVLAMSNYQLHQLDEARAALATGLEIADTKLPKIESGDLGPYWPDWVFADTLMREARALIEGSSKTSDESKTNPSSAFNKEEP